MRAKKMRRVMAFLLFVAFILCAAFLLQNYEIKAAIELVTQGAEWDGEAAIYWNPGESLLSYDAESDLATRSDVIRKTGQGSDRANGLSPDTAVKSFNTALGRAEKLSRRMEIDLTEVVIYAMNPMVISQGNSFVINGKEVTVVPWDGSGEEKKPIFIVAGGTLSLNHITLQSEYDGVSEDLVLVYASSGKIQIGEQVEVYGTFALDYTQLESDWSMSTASNANSYMATASNANSQPKDDVQEPVIELTNWFDFVEGSYTLELSIPEEREEDVIAIRTLHASQMSEEDFLEAFTINGTTEDWEILAEGRVDGIFHDTTPIEQDMDLILSNSSASNASDANVSDLKQRSITNDEPEIILTQKNLIARRVGGVIQGSKISGKIWLDRNSNGIIEESERAIPDYNVSLFAANDRSTPVQTVKTQADGSYRFDNLKAGSYVVGIVSEVIGAREYLLPQVGIINDNKFEKTEIIKAVGRMAVAEERVATAYSELVTIAPAAAVPEALNAGLNMGASLSNFDIAYIYKPLGGHTLKSGDETKLVVMAAAEDLSTAYYRSYVASEAGLSLALYELYEENTPLGNYIMYIGADFTVSASNIFADKTSASGTTDASFAALRGRINTLVITGLQTDGVTDTAATTAPTACRLFTVSGSTPKYFGTNIILRNIQYTFATGVDNTTTNGIYMNGYNLTLGGNSWHTAATSFFGGSTAGTVTPVGGTASITVYSTGTGASYFFGGMRTGTLDGNVETTIKGTSTNAISIWGGGLGTSTSLAYVTGNITNTITGMATTGSGLSSFIGGFVYGNVSGSITNTISGRGRLSTCYFYGGSTNGNIGTDATLRSAQNIVTLSDVDMDDYIIKNDIDFSEYAAGSSSYFGTNSTSGIVKGNVINIVKAGSYNSGSIRSYAGGLGNTANNSRNDNVMSGGWHTTFAVNTTTAKVTEAGIANGLAAAKTSSQYQLYGNLVNNIRAGSISYNNYWRGVGWGYMEGNAYSEVGTEGLVYKQGNNTYKPSKTDNNQGEGTAFDLVGGGGNVGGNTEYGGFCIKGNTTLVTREVFARWTYGGSFGGVQIGDSKISFYKGIVDTCEGTGYLSYLHVGNGRAEVHGGQVDWFLSGGGWGDRYQDGNVSVEVYDEPDIIINASIGGTYGTDSSQRISGDSTIIVHGGDFSGTAGYLPTQGFSAGPSNAGYILGNANLTMDLRGNQHGFSIESGDSISGGRRRNAGASSYLGTDEANTITVNIFSDEANTNLLNGLNIYGDCTYDTTYWGNTRSGKITINVNAPGAIIGNLYATSYSNITTTGTTRLRRNVEINLVSVDTLTGLYCGNGQENLTNTIAEVSATAGKWAVINVGPQSTDAEDVLGEREVGEPEDGLPHRINISTGGIIGFTSLNIQKRLLVAQAGNIKNGYSATLANHGSNYYNFGTLTLRAGEGVNASGLGISSETAVFIAGAAQVVGAGEVYIQSTGSSNQIILKDLVIPSTSVVTWLKIGSVAAKTDLQTNWFGVKSGWQVITLSPDKTKAYDRITPVNFRGKELSAEKVFIGDSDTHLAINYGYVVAILGTNYTWNVVEGHGTISHNVPVSTTPPAQGETIWAYGTVLKDTPSRTGNFSIPSQFIPGTVDYPEFKFVPDDSYDECVNYVNIYGSDQYISPTPHNYQITRGGMYETKIWTAKGDDGEYSFDIIASFEEGDISVYGRNVIITETEAMAISSADDLIAYTQAGGTPWFGHFITEELLAEITTPLVEGRTYRPHQVTYEAVNNNNDGKSLTVMVVVVKDETVVSTNRQYAVYANDAFMVLNEAQALTGQTALDSGYTNAVAILADGTNAVPVIDEYAIGDITGTISTDCPKEVLVTYSYAPDGQPELVYTTVKVVIQNQSKIMVSKEVKGDYIDKTKDFSFTIFVSSSNGTPLTEGTQLIYTGSTLAGFEAEDPAGGTLTLDSESKAVFILKHGQQVEIEAPRLNERIRIVEAENSHYKTSYIVNGSTIDEKDTGMIQMGTTDIAIDFINTRIRTAVYIDGISGQDDNTGYKPKEPVKTLVKAYEQLEAVGANVIYVVGTVPINEDMVITAAGYTSSSNTVTLSGTPVQLDIRRFARPIAGDYNNAALYDEEYDMNDFQGVLFQVKDGATFTIGGGVYVDGHYYPKTGAEYSREFTVDRVVEVVSALIEVESGGELILQEGARLKDNRNFKEVAIDESRTEGGAIHNSGTVKLRGAEISGNGSLKGAGIYQNGIFEIISNPGGIEGQEIYLTAVKGGTVEEPVWQDHIITTAVWLDAALKLSVNMDHAVAGRPVVRYANHEDVDPQWENYILGTTVAETLFLVEHATDKSLLELQNWEIMNISIPNEIYLVVQQDIFGDIGVKRADSSGFTLDSPTYKIKNSSLYEAKVFLTGFVNKNDSVGINTYELMNLVPSALDAVSDTAEKTDLYLAIAGTDDGNGNFGTLPETSLHDFNVEGGKQQELGVLEGNKEGGFEFIGTASKKFIAYYADDFFPFYGIFATAENRIAHLRNKDPNTGETSANNARATFRMTFRVEMVR